MCLSLRQLDSTTRRIYAAGNGCVFTAILLQVFFEQSFGRQHPMLFNGIRFLLTGLAIVLLAWFVRRRSCAGAPRHGEEPR